MKRLTRIFPALAVASLVTLPGLPANGAVRPSSAIVTQDAFLPAVHVVGATGVFRTDVSIFNPQQTTVNVDLYFTPADTDGSSLSGLSISGGLNARETVTLTDILGDPNFFNRTNSYGILEVRSKEGAVIVTSNTYNVAGAVAGTYGQFSPGQPIEDALGFENSDAGDLYLPGLPFDANHRVNAVVINPSGVSLEAGVQLVDAVGNILGTKTYTVPPYSMHQLNDIFGAEFAQFGPTSAAAPYRLNTYVNLDNTARILSYATVTDTRTGDPYLITGLAQIR